MSADRNLVDFKGAISVLVNEDIQDINQSELVLGKLPEFSPEYQALMQNSQLVLGMQAAGGGPIDPEMVAMAQHQQAYNQ